MVPTISLIPGLNSQKVYLAVNGRVEERVVKTGIRTSEQVQILEGLEPGDKVLTTGLLQVRPGLAVRVVSHQPENTQQENGGQVQVGSEQVQVNGDQQIGGQP